MSTCGKGRGRREERCISVGKGGLWVVYMREGWGEGRGHGCVGRVGVFMGICEG